MDEKFMKMALHQAKLAAGHREVPVGAVIVKDGEVIAKAYNRKERYGCANFHAEIVAIEKACKAVGDWRLTGCCVCRNASRSARKGWCRRRLTY